MLSSILYNSILKDFAHLIIRVFTGALLIHHGFEKLNDISNFADAFVRPLHLPFPVTLSYFAAFAEIVGSWFLILGFATRLGALAILGTMSVAIYHAVATSGFNIYLLELLGLYFSSAAAILMLGPGKFSVDFIIYEFFTEPKVLSNFNNQIIPHSSEIAKNKLVRSNEPRKKKSIGFPFTSFLSS